MTTNVPKQGLQTRSSSRTRFSKIANLMDEAEIEMLAYVAFPPEHWQKDWSNYPLERLNKGIKRRINVVGAYPTRCLLRGW